MPDGVWYTYTMTNFEFLQKIAPCCLNAKGEGRSCRKFKSGDRIIFDGGASVWSVRAYTATVTTLTEKGLGVEFIFDGYGNVGEHAARNTFHLREE